MGQKKAPIFSVFSTTDLIVCIPVSRIRDCRFRNQLLYIIYLVFQSYTKTKIFEKPVILFTTECARSVIIICDRVIFDNDSCKGLSCGPTQYRSTFSRVVHTTFRTTIDKLVSFYRFVSIVNKSYLFLMVIDKTGRTSRVAQFMRTYCGKGYYRIFKPNTTRPSIRLIIFSLELKWLWYRGFEIY